MFFQGQKSARSFCAVCHYQGRTGIGKGDPQGSAQIPAGNRHIVIFPPECELSFFHRGEKEHHSHTSRRDFLKTEETVPPLFQRDRTVLQEFFAHTGGRRQFIPVQRTVPAAGNDRIIITENDKREGRK